MASILSAAIPSRVWDPRSDWAAWFDPLGGELLFIVNEEARFPVWRELSGLLFMDAGNVWATPSDFDGDLFFAAGLGFRAVTPLGLLRLDLAFPLNGRPTDPEYKIYAGFGTVF